MNRRPVTRHPGTAGESRLSLRNQSAVAASVVESMGLRASRASGCGQAGGTPAARRPPASRASGKGSLPAAPGAAALVFVSAALRLSVPQPSGQARVKPCGRCGISSRLCRSGISSRPCLAEPSTPEHADKRRAGSRDGDRAKQFQRCVFPVVRLSHGGSHTGPLNNIGGVRCGRTYDIDVAVLVGDMAYKGGIKSIGRTWTEPDGRAERYHRRIPAAGTDGSSAARMGATEGGDRHQEPCCAAESARECG